MNLFRRGSNPVVGLDIGSSAIKLVQLREHKRGYSLEKCGIKLLDPELIVDGAVMDSGRVTERLKELLAEQRVKACDAVLSVSGNAVIVKKINVPAMTEQELEESIKWEAEQYIPFDINDVSMDFQILGGTEGGDAQQMSVLLVAVKKDRLNEYGALATDAGLTPVIMDVDAFALENMYGVNYAPGENEYTVLVNIGAAAMNINVVRGGVFAFSRDIGMGGNRYTEAIQKELSVGYDEAERAKKQEPVEGVDPDAVGRVITAIHQDVAAEVVRSIDYFKTTTGIDHVDSILLSGGCAKTVGLPEVIAEKTGVRVETANPFARIDVNPKRFPRDFLGEFAPMAAVGVGLATRRVGDR